VARDGRNHRYGLTRAECVSLGSTLAFSVLDGGADRDRTGDLLVANQALSQLSYSPGRVAEGGGPKWI
jgi:hypothetical protein